MYYDNFKDYKIPILDNKSYISIFYKNMTIQWVLEEYDNKRAFIISQKVLNVTKNTSYVGAVRTFICNSKKDLNKIYNILYEEYYQTKKQHSDINLLKISINMLLNKQCL